MVPVCFFQGKQYYNSFWKSLFSFEQSRELYFTPKSIVILNRTFKSKPSSKSDMINLIMWFDHVSGMQPFKSLLCPISVRHPPTDHPFGKISTSGSLE